MYRRGLQILFALLLTRSYFAAQNSNFVIVDDKTVLAPAGCAKAHCDDNESDAVHAIAPSAGDIVSFDPLTAGAKRGLGCSSNLTVVACTFASESPPNLVVYDGDGQRVFADDGGLLNSKAYASAPVVFKNSKVLATDNMHMILFNADGSVKWMSTLANSGTPISPVLIGSNVILLATNGGSVSTWDLYTGKMLGSLTVADPEGCATYKTVNTPTVNGDRAYILVNCTTDATDGGLAAVDIATDRGQTRGIMRQAWLYKFVGPSGASPLFHGGAIFFDGLAEPNSSQGVFMGVYDAGDVPMPIWSKTFPSNFAANAALDPRGGFWIFPVGVPHLYRLNALDGSLVQTLDIPTPPGMNGYYAPSSAVSVSATMSGDVVLTLGIESIDPSDQSAVMAADVTASTILWLTLIDPDLTGNSTSAQFPIVKNAANLPRVVFPGSVSGTYFIGNPN